MIIGKQIISGDDTLMARCYQILKSSQAISEDQEIENTGTIRNMCISERHKLNPTTVLSLENNI